MLPDPVVIVPYDEDWPHEFAREAARLRAAFGDTPIAIEHIGSTAVPGLAAKPIVDLLLGAASLAAIEQRIPALEALGYEYVPEYERELPERRYFRRPATPPRTHHLHAVALGGSFWQRHLAFRDALRARPERAAAYADLKRRLAERLGSDREGYTTAKSDFIASVLHEAGLREPA